MKVWIDKQGGLHYHKDGCVMIDKAPQLHPYVEVEHTIRKIPLRFRKIFGEYRNITIDHKRYMPCPICFGDKRK